MVCTVFKKDAGSLPGHIREEWVCDSEDDLMMAIERYKVLWEPLTYGTHFTVLTLMRDSRWSTIMMRRTERS